MPIIVLILLLAGAIFFLLAACGVAARINLVALGLACWITVPLIHAIQAVN